MAQNNKNLKIALFCGGAGTRMWPMSRVTSPKQFQPLIGDKSTFEMMVTRLNKEFAMSDIFPVTVRDNVGWIVKLAPEIPLENIIIEPATRDTAAAVGLAATILNKKFNNPYVLALWSDHVVRNEGEFIKAIKLAHAMADEMDKFVEIGVRPTFPSVALGYLKVGKMLKSADGLAVFEFIKQIEKPNYATAKRFVESWEYLWHIGYSVWPAQKMISKLEKHFSEGARSLARIGETWGSSKQETVLQREYAKIPKTSIDFAVNAHLTAQDQIVVSADLSWRDVGTWSELMEEMSQNSADNITKGEIIDIDLKGCLVYEPKRGKIIAAIGLEGLVIVDTEDALLICPKERSQDVKKVIDKLKEAKKDKYL